LEKIEVYFNEYNVLMDNAVYLPIVSGQLQAFAHTKPIIQENYTFMPFIFYRDTPDRIVSQYQNPGVAAFSISMWNANLSLRVAQKVKEKFPECLIVFGGHDVPNRAENYLRMHGFVDLVVRGEGEKTFAQILENGLERRSFEDIQGITYRNKSGKILRNNEDQVLEKNLDVFPSPYLEGVFDEIIASHDINFQAIVETNRGCPFKCSYCSWGQGGLSKKYRFFSLERARQLSEWIGKCQIGYVFCADSNYGMFQWDFEIAQFFVDAKQKYGFPEKFRTCYSKNAEETVYKIGKLLHENAMEKSITLSLQTTNLDAAKYVRRKNIKLSVFNDLQERYNKAGVPTYTELILGLPGETYKSFLDGLEKCLQSGIENQLFTYHCQVYPNAEMGNKEYQKKYKIKTIRCPLKEVHAVPRADGVPEEYEEVVVSTYSMPEQDWKKATVVSWIMQLFHGLKVGFYPMKHIVLEYDIKYTAFFDYISDCENIEYAPMIRKEIDSYWQTADLILHGEARCKIVSEFSPIYWEPEEASFLNISHNKEGFYGELREIFINFLTEKGIDFNYDELRKTIEYQELRLPDFNEDYKGDKEKFAKEVLLWGRKSGRILRK
jgi:tRNA A37 methylthiotransferase MiaB